MKYVCKRCGHSETHKGNFLKHLNRKKQCQVIYLDIPTDTLIKELDDKNTNCHQVSSISVIPSVNNDNISENSKKYFCKYCNLGFTTRQSKSRHELKNSCKEKIKKEKLKHQETTFEKEEIALMKQIMGQKDEEMAQKDEEMALMRKQIEFLISKIGNTNIENTNCNNITNNTTNNITNIQINGWGEEDRSHLTDKFYRFCYDRPFTSIQRVIEAVFFNPNCPENWNVMIKDDKSSKAIIYDREKDAWLKKETNGILEDLTHIGYSMLDENFDKQRDANKLTDRIIEKFTNFQDFYAKGDKHFEKRLASEIKELLINYKAYHTIKGLNDKNNDNHA